MKQNNYKWEEYFLYGDNSDKIHVKFKDGCLCNMKLTNPREEFIPETFEDFDEKYCEDCIYKFKKIKSLYYILQ